MQSSGIERICLIFAFDLVLEMESLFVSPDCCREDLASLLRSVQVQEKEKLHLTVTIQVLKKAGRPSERLVSHENCRFRQSTGHECVHIQQITEASGTEEAEADSEYDNSLKEAIKGVQDGNIITKYSGLLCLAQGAHMGWM
ncbi:hypothetical protein ACS0TY_012961 [Phlomoides rotata]